jgi:hypothetical protein
MPNSPGFRVSAAFITDTYGKKQRDRPPAGAKVRGWILRTDRDALSSIKT